MHEDSFRGVADSQIWISGHKYHGACYLVGYACATQTAGWSYEHIAPQFNFVLFAAAVFVTVTAFFLVEDSGGQAAEAGYGDRDGRDGILSRLLGRPQFLLFAAVSFLFSGTTNANNTYVSLLLKELFGNTTSVGTVLFFSTLMELPLILFSGRYMERFSGRTLLRIDIALIIAQYVCYSVSPWTVPVCVILFFCKSTATMLFIMVTLKIVLNVVDADCQTTALSLIATAKGVGGAVITFAAGLVSDAFGLRAVYLLLSAAALICLALTWAMRLPEEGEKLF